MLHVVVIRREGERTAYGHIGADETRTRVFCGLHTPTPVLEMWGDPRNPYLDRTKVTCEACLTEWNNGRTSGYSDPYAAVPGVVEPVPADPESPPEPPAPAPTAAERLAQMTSAFKNWKPPA